MQRGQTAFEVIFLFIIIISGAIIISSYYLQIGDDTTALAITRAEINSQLATTNEYSVIESIHIVKSPADTNINAKLSTPVKINTALIASKISASTSLKNVRVNIN